MLTRRDFLKLTTLSLTAVAAAGLLPAQSASTSDEPEWIDMPLDPDKEYRLGFATDRRWFEDPGMSIAIKSGTSTQKFTVVDWDALPDGRTALNLRSTNGAIGTITI